MERKIKVLEYISTGFIAGEVRQLLILVKNLDKTKFEVDVVCFEGVVADYLRQCGLEKEGIGLKAIEFEGGRRLATFFLLYNLLRKERYQIVHVHPVTLGGIPARLAAKLAGAKIVITESGTAYRHHWAGNPLWTFLAIFPHLLWNSIFLDRMIATTNAISDSVIRRERINPKQVAIIHYGIDVDDFQCPAKDSKELKRKLGLEENTFVIGTISRLIPHKQINKLIEAFAKVAREIPEVKLLIVGIGPSRASLEKQCAELELSHQVIFSGWSNEIAELIRMMDVFALLAPYQEVGLATLEAMASAKPVIITQTSWLAQAMENGKTGILVPPGDTQALASAIVSLLSDRALSLRIGEAGRRLVREKFNSRVMVAKTEKVYQNLYEDIIGSPAVK